MYKPPSYATGGVRTIEATDFGDHVTADHIVIYRDQETVIEDSRLALVIKDVATGFCYAYPSALKTAEECTCALQHFTSSKDVVKNFYSDRAPELNAAAKKMKWRHEKSKAYLRQTNAIAERQVLSATEGTRTVTDQSSAGWRLACVLALCVGAHMYCFQYQSCERR